MGLLDDMQGMMSNATSSAGRSVELMKLKSKVKEINQERARLAAQLGAALYEKTKGDSAFTSGLESLYAGIGELDAERAKANAQITQMEREGKERVEARQMYECPNCKSMFSSADVFCSGCGKRVEELLSSMQVGSGSFPTHSPKICPVCGLAVDEEDAFCMGCGADLRKAVAPAAAKQKDAELEEETQEPASVETPDEAVPVVDQEAAERSDPVCPQCGSTTQPDDRFCMSCGYKLSQE